MSGRYFAVYGTLRPGCRNSIIWDGSVLLPPLATVVYDGALVHGYALIMAPDGAWPYAVPIPEHDTYVTVLQAVAPDDELLKLFDKLEGYPDHYDRAQVQATWPTGDNAERSVEATMYFLPSQWWIKDAVQVPGNDWLSLM